MRESEAMFLFVTGTDTGCGKTTFACALLRRFGEMGVRGAPCKPVETGCESGADGALIPADGGRLVACSPTPIDDAIAAPHRFGDPVSPAIAMEKHGAELSLEDLEKAVREASRHCDVLVVEGAGGALSPIAKDALGLDLAERLGATVVVVAPDVLGVQSHAIAVLESCRRRAIAIGGVVLDRTTDMGEPSQLGNERMIREFGGVRVFPSVPYAPAKDLGVIVDHLRAHRIAEVLLDAARRP